MCSDCTEAAKAADKASVDTDLDENSETQATEENYGSTAEENPEKD